MIIPKTMLAARQKTVNGELIIEQIPVPAPGKGQVLVKVHCSPVNPSDLSFLQGTYSSRPDYPVTPGIEACGTVVASGGGILPRLRMNKRVACTSTNGYGGAWAEYMVTDAAKCIPVSHSISDANASMLIVNPMTALAFIREAKRMNTPAIIQTAAAGALGKLMVQLCKQEGITLINIVRSQSNIPSLQSIGADNIICSSLPDFSDQLSAISHQFGARMAIDCIGGKLTGTIVSALEPHSMLFAYAKLSESDSTYDARVLVQKDLCISGFYLSHWVKRQKLVTVLRTIRNAKKLMAGASNTPQQLVSLNDINDGIAAYRQNMGAGKVLIDLQS